MFLKPYKMKSNVPLKGSDSKRLRQRIEQEFPHLTNETMQHLIPAKGKVTALKVITYKDFTTTVYCVDRQPMLFETDELQLAPTVYALWQVTDLLPYFTTVPSVLPRLVNGADLMLPGIIAQGTGLNMYGRYAKGQMVAINLTSNTYAVAVGVLLRSTDDLYMCGGKGSAVRILHLFGDKLWAHEPSLSQQMPTSKPVELTDDDFPMLGSSGGDVESDDNIAASSIATNLNEMTLKANSDEYSKETADETTISDNLAAVQTNGSSLNDDEGDNEGNALKKEVVVENSVDTVLRSAFLTALKNHGTTIQLPVLTSNFYRLYVIPEAQSPIDVKKTKYKKLSTFLQEMVNDGFIAVREEAKGVDKITAIHMDHPELTNLITEYKKPCNDGDNGEQPLFHSELTELYLVTDETAAFFTRMNYKNGEGIPCGQVKKIIREYVSKNELRVVEASTKSIELDECLAKICECPSAPMSKICEAVVSKMTQSYQMCSGLDFAKKPLIQMSLATRSGNKKVTLVSNVECYGIIIPELVKLCKQGAAASTTVIKLPAQKREQLQIQGNQIRFVYNLLTETYKVPAKCILGLELAKTKKKSGKK